MGPMIQHCWAHKRFCHPPPFLVKGGFYFAEFLGENVAITWSSLRMEVGCYFDTISEAHFAVLMVSGNRHARQALHERLQMRVIKEAINPDDGFL